MQQMDFFFDDEATSQIKPLSQILEESLGQLIFNDASKRVSIANLGAWTYFGDRADVYPGVSFYYTIKQSDSVASGRADVMLGLTSSDDAFSYRSITEKTPKEFADKIDEILKAFGYSRQGAFDMLSFKPITEVNATVLACLQQRNDLGYNPFQVSGENKKQYDAAIRTIVAKLGTEDFRVDFGYKVGFSPEKGERFLVSCTPNSQPSIGGGYFPAPTCMPAFQMAVLDVFLRQTTSSERLQNLLKDDGSNLPKLLAETAQEAVNAMERGRIKHHGR